MRMYACHSWRDGAKNDVNCVVSATTGPPTVAIKNRLYAPLSPPLYSVHCLSTAVICAQMYMASHYIFLSLSLSYTPHYLFLSSHCLFTAVNAYAFFAICAPRQLLTNPHASPGSDWLQATVRPGLSVHHGHLLRLHLQPSPLPAMEEKRSIGEQQGGQDVMQRTTTLRRV